MVEAINTTWVHLSAHKSHMELLNLLEQVLGAKFKFESRVNNLGVMMDRNLGFVEKSPDSNPLITAPKLHVQRAS